MARIIERVESGVVLEIEADCHPDHPSEAGVPMEDRFLVGNKIIVTDCGEIGRASDRYKYTCSCPWECRGGERLRIAEIRVS